MSQSYILKSGIRIPVESREDTLNQNQIICVLVEARGCSRKHLHILSTCQSLDGLSKRGMSILNSTIKNFSADGTKTSDTTVKGLLRTMTSIWNPRKNMNSQDKSHQAGERPFQNLYHGQLCLFHINATFIQYPVPVQQAISALHVSSFFISLSF